MPIALACLPQVGPRYGHAFLMLGTAPVVFSIATINDAAGFILCRFFIGLSLATFVANQFWTSVMFTGKIVGLANATSGGWGNLGGGVTQILMPLIFLFITDVIDASDFAAWRWCFFVPGVLHVLVGVGVLFFAQDLPDGTYLKLVRKGERVTDNATTVFITGIKNYRMWILTLTYGYCFGVELTINNIAAPYMNDQFDLDLTTAGLVASCFGLMNIFARSVGGLVSDRLAVRFGMRGRLWSLWILQTLEGVCCIWLGFSQDSLAMTVVVLIIFSLFVQSAEGATYGVVPFVSRRALGVVSGFIGAGGNAGSAITQAIFFRDSSLETYEGLRWMGVMVIGITLTVFLIHFPMWGGMLFPGNPDVSEKDYYLGDFNEEDSVKYSKSVEAITKFAENSQMERGSKRVSEGTPTESEDATEKL